MHPAISVIFFTVTSGAGFGLIALIGLGYPLRETPLGFLATAVLAGGLAVAGLLSSTFHLGHPERAWRAFSQWRSSWLSREGVCAVATLVLFGLYCLPVLFGGAPIAMLGLPVATLALATVFTTAMIYAQLKTVPQWNSVLTPAVYLGFALASGFLLAAAAGRADALLGLPVALGALVLLVIAWGLKLAWWRAAKENTLSARGMTRESATGLGGIGKVRLLERPHSGENYLTREMAHRIARKHAHKLRMIALGLGAIVPAVRSEERL